MHCCRWGVKPDGVCLVVGGCARGFDPATNATADLIYTASDLQPAGAAAATSSAADDDDQSSLPSSSSSSSAAAAAAGVAAGAAAGSHQLQYFWEAFPASDGLPVQGRSSNGTSSSSSSSSRFKGSDARTTYLFTYCDAQAWRPSLAQVLNDYWRLMPEYQGLKDGLDGLTFTRLLFGFFPTYKDSPLKPGFDR